MIGLTFLKRLTLVGFSGLLAVFCLFALPTPASAAPTSTTGEIQGGKYYVAITYPDQSVEKAYLTTDNTTITIRPDVTTKSIAINNGQITISNLPPGAYSVNIAFKQTRDACDHADKDGNKEGGFGRCTISGIKGSNDRHFSFTGSYSAVVAAGQITYLQNQSDTGTARLLGNAVELNADGSPRVNCSGKGILMSFVICPMIESILGIVDWLVNNFIQPYLTINPLRTTETDGTPSQLYLIWNNIRNFANILFVLTFFVIIFSQATSIGISNYGIKRLLPRLILIAIGTNISFFICAFLVDVFNVLGAGAASLLVNAILNGSATINLGNVDLLIALFGASLISPFGPLMVIAAAPIIFGIFIFLLIAAAIIFMAAVVILLRQIIIIGLILVSPLALVAGLLPNTQKLLTQWFTAFAKLLAMYPIIMVLFAAGKVASAVLQKVGPVGEGAGPQAVLVIISFLAFVLPLVAVPFSFKFAGSGLHKLYGSIQNGVQRARRTATKAAVKGAKMTPWGQEAQQHWNQFKAGRVRDAADRASRRRAGGGVVGNVLRRVGGRSANEAANAEYRDRTTKSLAQSVSVPHAVADLARMERGQDVEAYIAGNAQIQRGLNAVNNLPVGATAAQQAAAETERARAETRVAALREGATRFRDQIGNDNFREAALSQALVAGADHDDIAVGLDSYVRDFQGSAADLASSFGHLNSTAKGAGLQAFSGGGFAANPNAGQPGQGNFVYNAQGTKGYDRILSSMTTFQGVESNQLSEALPGGGRGNLFGLGRAVMDELESADAARRTLMLRRIAQSQGSKAMGELLDLVTRSTTSSPNGANNARELQRLIRNV